MSTWHSQAAVHDPGNRRFRHPATGRGPGRSLLAPAPDICQGQHRTGTRTGVRANLGMPLRKPLSKDNTDTRPMDDFFHPGERQLQRAWQTEAIWDEARRQRLLWREIPEELHARIEGAPFFFLATSDAAGRCDCSFKGGGPGLVRIIDPHTLVFADFDGNHAFMSLGNILDNPYVGLLFIDFADGARLRVNGSATIHDDIAQLELFSRLPHVRRVVRVQVEQVVPNCAAHVPRLVPAATRG